MRNKSKKERQGRPVRRDRKSEKTNFHKRASFRNRMNLNLSNRAITRAVGLEEGVSNKAYEDIRRGKGSEAAPPGLRRRRLRVLYDNLLANNTQSDSRGLHKPVELYRSLILQRDPNDSNSGSVSRGVRAEQVADITRILRPFTVEGASLEQHLDDAATGARDDLNVIESKINGPVNSKLSSAHENLSSLVEAAGERMKSKDEFIRIAMTVAGSLGPVRAVTGTFGAIRSGLHASINAVASYAKGKALEGLPSVTSEEPGAPEEHHETVQAEGLHLLNRARAAFLTASINANELDDIVDMAEDFDEEVNDYVEGRMDEENFFEEDIRGFTYQLPDLKRWFQREVDTAGRLAGEIEKVRRAVEANAEEMEIHQLETWMTILWMAGLTESESDVLDDDEMEHWLDDHNILAARLPRAGTILGISFGRYTTLADQLAAISVAGNYVATARRELNVWIAPDE